MQPDSAPSSSEAADAAGLEALLEYLKRARRIDFTGYKRSSLARRLQRRMQMVSAPTYAAYTDYLEVHPDEFRQLFNTVLINVTGFFRDPAAWDALATHLPRIVAARAPDRPIRVWSAGCASGEEAYTLAMLLAEALGPEELAKRVTVYATDIDDEALAHARQGRYAAESVGEIPPPLLEKYFTRTGDSYALRRELRRAVIFARHDLVQDAPISGIDVLGCRNALIYFTAETQTRVLSRLHFALSDEGILFLGKAEMLLTHGDLFTPVDLKLRIFARTPRSSYGTRDRTSAPDAPASEERPNGGAGALGPAAAIAPSALHEAVFDAAPIAVVVLDAQGRLVLVNRHARRMLELGSRDLGRPFHELELSYRPTELRSFVDRARAERRPVNVRDVALSGAGDEAFVDIGVVPLFAPTLELIATQINFTDVTHQHRLRHELLKAHMELETAQEELQSTSEELEMTTEEMESMHDELRRRGEELERVKASLGAQDPRRSTVVSRPTSAGAFALDDANVVP